MKLVVLIALLGFALPFQADQPPTYKDFPARGTFVGKPANLILNSSKARAFRTVLRRETAAGPNFAGHFTLARWGCGAGCISWAIIDARSGRIWFAPFTVEDASAAKILEDRNHSIDFELTSELIVVNGALNGAEAGHFYYRWHDGVLTRVYFRRHDQ